MKKFWMMLAIAGLFATTVVSCGEKKEGEATEESTEAEPTEEATEEAAPTEEAPAETPADTTEAAPAE